MTARPILLGIGLTILGAVMQGSFVFPMSRTVGWRWANTWLIYSLVGLLVLPVSIAVITVPELASVYRLSSAGAIWTAAAFGCAWGLANVLFGLAVAAAGMSISFSIVCGLSASFGALLPLAILTPDRLLEPAGITVMTGVALALGGVYLIGMAGRKREISRGVSVRRGAITKGIFLALAAGMLAPALNFSFAFGRQIMENAVRHGANAMSSGDALWVVCLAGGFVSNGAYAMWQLSREHAWTSFCGSSLRGTSGWSNWLMAFSMGVLFTGGILFYSRGATVLGTFGPIIGWPVFQATMVLTSTFLGVLGGEWDDTERHIIGLLILGLSVLIAAIVVLSLANRI